MVGSVTVVRSAEGSDALVDSVHEVMRAMFRRASPALEAEGISMGQFWALHMISSLDAAPQSLVARNLGVSAPTLCAKLDEMESSGLVVRRRSDRDRRVVELSLTAKGRRTEARVWAWFAQMMREAAVGLRPADVATAVRVFQDIGRGLDARPADHGGRA